MTYQEFCSSFLTQLTEKRELGVKPGEVQFYPEGLSEGDVRYDEQFVRETNLRYNQTESDVLIGDYVTVAKAKNEQMKQISRFSLEELYDRQVAEGWESVWKQVQDSLHAAGEMMETGVLEQMHNYEQIRDKLVIRPVCFNDCRRELREYVYERYGDVALVLYLTVYDGERGLGTVKVPRTTADGWKLPRKRVWEDAMLNTYVAAPPRLYLDPVDCIHAPYEKGEFMSENSAIQKLDPERAPLLTTTRKLNGAIAIFYPGVKERLARLSGGSYYVAFTSVNEACIHPAGTILPIRILRSLKHLNRTCGEAERLSQKVFFYDAEDGSFKTVEF